ncbi:hypothetical protein [Amycolatopsis pretoriensis]|uniref:hypothetical protein n=1 Tax=Amycolatopsis pretoriensis TaxID=218821 RepID=UPI001B809F76|nr:hypothetical protein [Amycolatopsis pretoriensis]
MSQDVNVASSSSAAAGHGQRVERLFVAERGLAQRHLLARADPRFRRAFGDQQVQPRAATVGPLRRDERDQVVGPDGARHDPRPPAREAFDLAGDPQPPAARALHDDHASHVRQPRAQGRGDPPRGGQAADHEQVQHGLAAARHRRRDPAARPVGLRHPPAQAQQTGGVGEQGTGPALRPVRDDQVRHPGRVVAGPEADDVDGVRLAAEHRRGRSAPVHFGRRGRGGGQDRRVRGGPVRGHRQGSAVDVEQCGRAAGARREPAEHRPDRAGFGGQPGQRDDVVGSIRGAGCRGHPTWPTVDHPLAREALLYRTGSRPEGDRAPPIRPQWTTHRRGGGRRR